jgi:hypothetical protein
MEESQIKQQYTSIVSQLPQQSPYVKVLKKIASLPEIDDVYLEFLTIILEMHKHPQSEEQIKHGIHHLVASMDYSIEKLKEFNKTYHL